MVNPLKDIAKLFRQPKKEVNVERRIKHRGMKTSNFHKPNSYLKRGNFNKVGKSEIANFEKLKHEHRQASHEQEYLKAVKKQREIFHKEKPINSSSQFSSIYVTPSSSLTSQKVLSKTPTTFHNFFHPSTPKITVKPERKKEKPALGNSLQNPSITFFHPPQLKDSPSQEVIGKDEQKNRPKVALSSKSSLVCNRNVLADHSQALMLQTILEGLKDLQDIEARLPHKHIFQ